MCNSCNKIRPGVTGWACKHCTFINEMLFSFCKSCGEYKINESATSNRGWECSCGEIISEKLSRCSCGRSRKCKLCKKEIKSKCDDCYTSLDCIVCKLNIPKKDGKICIKCKRKTDGRCNDCDLTINYRCYICEECTNMLKQCTYCKKFSLPDARVCSNINCRNSSNLSEKNTPSKKLEDVCKKCLRKINKCTCELDIDCSICKQAIQKIDGKICYKCQNIPNLGCLYCNKTTPKNYFACKSCIKKLKKCEKCGYYGIDLKKCENFLCANSMIIVPTIKNNGSTIEYPEKNGNAHTKIKKSTICRICNRELNEAYGFCLDCKLKFSSPKCKFCDIIICKNLCEICIRSTDQCLICKHRYHIADITCPNCSN